MVKGNQAPDGNSTAASKSNSKQSSGLLRGFFFLSVVSNIVMFYKLETTFQSERGTYASGEKHLSGEAISFLPPTLQSNGGSSIHRQQQQRQHRHHQHNNHHTAAKAVADANRQSKPANAKQRKLPKPYNIQHFLNHIPKTGAEYAAKELSKLLLATIPLPGNKTILSIQEAQARYNRSLWKDPNYDPTDPDWLFFHPDSRKHDHTNPDADAFLPSMVCNHGTKPLPYTSPFFFGLSVGGKNHTRTEDLKFYCSLLVSERQGNRPSQNTYTIVREPVSHVVSQYFHCVDANSRQDHHRDKMPSLDEWLAAYANLSASLELQKRPPYIQHWRVIPEAKALRERFECYNPIDSESDYVGFPGRDPDGFGRLILPDDYTYPYPYPSKDELNLLSRRDEATRRLDQQLFDDLKTRFQVIGDMARMVQTICAIFIHMTDGQHIPTPCDCTHSPQTPNKNNKEDPHFRLFNLYQKQEFGRKYRRNPRWYMRPYVELGYNAKKHAHGVQTRGSAFVREGGLSEPQTAQILEQLRSLDRVLYNVSRAVLDAQVAELETAHGIKICDAEFNREGQMDWEAELAKHAKEEDG